MSAFFSVSFLSFDSLYKGAVYSPLYENTEFFYRIYCCIAGVDRFPPE